MTSTEHTDAATPATEIRVLTNGPYEVGPDVRLVDHLGLDVEIADHRRLCRCGTSATKPWCDESHTRNGFGDAPTGHAPTGDGPPDRIDEHVGVTVTIRDNRSLCAHSEMCTNRVGSAFHADSEPFVTPNGARADDLLAAARRCPSGALSVAFDGVDARAAVDSARPAEVVVSRDGPYWLRGGIAVTDEAGTPVERNAGASLEHCALCRCGRSANQPFCSGAHRSEGFTDPPAPERPTIFEWAGGYPALIDLLTLFYGKFIPEDDLLRPVFLEMSPDHPERVAAWLGEVFGGPPLYSEGMGGYQAMIMHHLGRSLDEEKRQRWVSLLVRAMDEVGLSNNAEFRAAVLGYVEWGTRIAVENSQPGATPPPNMPMPYWTWRTAAGPPWGRVAATDQPEPHLVTVADPDTTPTFGEHVSTLFRPTDIESMHWAFDLSSYDDVAAHAEQIAARTADGSMPPDAPWPTEHVEMFRRWIDAGMPT